MKNLFTLLTLVFLSYSAWAQTYFPIPVENGDLESTEPLTPNENGNAWFLGGGFHVNTPAGMDEPRTLVDTDNTGLAPGEGVDFSQAFRLALEGPAAAGWQITFRTGFIDYRPSGAGSYIFSYQLKSDSVITAEKIDGKALFWHTVAMFDDDGYITDAAIGSMIPWDDQFTLHEGYIEVKDTIDLQAEYNGRTPTRFFLNIQAGTHGFSYVFDDFNVQGPESFYDITFDVSNIVGEDTLTTEGTTVMFDGVSYTTDTEGTLTVSDLQAGSYDWSVTLDGFESQSGQLQVSKFETVSLYLEEKIVLGETPNITTSIYPNPASSKVTIQSQDSKLKSIEFVSLSGAVLHRQKMDVNVYDLDISSFQPGLYLVKIVDDRNETFVERLIISK